MMLLQVGKAMPTTPWELVLTSNLATKMVLGVLAVFSVVTWFMIPVSFEPSVADCYVSSLRVVLAFPTANVVVSFTGVSAAPVTPVLRRT